MVQGIKSKVLSSINEVTSLGLQSYSEAREMFVTAKGTTSIYPYALKSVE